MCARSLSEARRIVEAALASSSPADGVERALIGDPIEAGRFWVFLYQGKAYLERGDLDAMLAGNAPIVVPKDSGKPFTLPVDGDLDAEVRTLIERAATS